VRLCQRFGLCQRFLKRYVGAVSVSSSIPNKFTPRTRFVSSNFVFNMKFLLTIDIAIHKTKAREYPITIDLAIHKIISLILSFLFGFVSFINVNVSDFLTVSLCICICD